MTQRLYRPGYSMPELITPPRRSSASAAIRPSSAGSNGSAVRVTGDGLAGSGRAGGTKLGHPPGGGGARDEPGRAAQGLLRASGQLVQAAARRRAGGQEGLHDALDRAVAEQAAVERVDEDH